ncbi:hypothetical protein WJX72_009900 [[Myrmecia] bisecta]|uniref:AAA+ ATPase domain-containing protein n=1 Tax=[Myrmecia] bisecta TaxID=41462 RepID=A0AAW1QSB4_9CHLO
MEIEPYRGPQQPRRQRTLQDAFVEAGLQFAFLGASILGTGMLMRWIINSIDPSRQAAKKAAAEKKALLKKRFGVEIPTDQYEDMIATEVVNPQEINVTLADIGGLETIKEALEHKVIAPLQKPDLFRSSLLQQTKGILLYGPPGTGKTMLAKALAKESGANFLNIRASVIQSKWFGDTNKLVKSIFSFAWKIQPCIIFIDEVDSMLGRRKDHEHEAVTSLKTEFMQHWDGFLTNHSGNVMVLAATNRPYDLDEAVLRRFSAQFEVPLPSTLQRMEILRLILKRHATDQGPQAVEAALLENDGRGPEMLQLAAMTANCSGSDLREVCAQAASLPVHELLGEEKRRLMERPNAIYDEEECIAEHVSSLLRPVGLDDFAEVMKSFKPAVSHAEHYRHRSGAANGRRGMPVIPDPLMAATLLELAMQLAQQTQQARHAPGHVNVEVNGDANGNAYGNGLSSVDVEELTPYSSAAADEAPEDGATGKH